ncbi:hypothetical protein QBC34DRAFT_437884 [Podospora aff. communis PSN243]|uniref:Uncharacterized protein n=1 Tax=Podospora aff. communis PSN243 TaxID=3040156 RepID=A0AAV9GT58_9PEZI|nr:hypothetical protein QBC34DRAFT_437884 [Podospora aff. communis PSN243]
MMLLIFFFAATLAATLTTATPHRRRTIDPANIVVIPGAGLPSLASLNLTAADLYDPNFNPDLPPVTDLSPNMLHCAGPPDPVIPYRLDLAQVCLNFLNHPGNLNRPVVAHEPCERICTAKDNTPGVQDWVSVGVRAVNGKKESVSFAGHVAMAVEAVVRWCGYQGDEKLRVPGYEFAHANGEMRVDVAGEVGKGKGPESMCGGK